MEDIMRNIISLLLAALLLAPSGPGWSQGSTSAREAKASYEEGARHYDLAEYAEALDSFKDAYRAKTDPAFLFNIAQCLRKLERMEEAATFYRTYLRRAPEAPNRAEVERHLKDIESQLAAASPVIPQGTFPAQETPRIDLSPRPAPEIEEHPLYKRWWIWTAAGAVAAGAAATIIILARRDPTSIPSSGLGHQGALP
jgi:tetratricopeptide (TPR) repeat protein